MPQKTNKKGAILLLTTILLFVILGMVVSLSYVTVMEQKMSGKTKSSVASFYNSESGVEWTLNKIASATDSTILSAFGGASRFNTDYSVKCPDSFGTETCKVYLLDQDGKVITNTSLAPSDIKAVRSVGSQGGDTQRAIEAAVASGLSGSITGTFERFWVDGLGVPAGCMNAWGTAHCSSSSPWDGTCDLGNTSKLMSTSMDNTDISKGEPDCSTSTPIPNQCQVALVACVKD